MTTKMYSCYAPPASACEAVSSSPQSDTLSSFWAQHNEGFLVNGESASCLITDTGMLTCLPQGGEDGHGTCRTSVWRMHSKFRADGARFANRYRQYGRSVLSRTPGAFDTRVSDYLRCESYVCANAIMLHATIGSEITRCLHEIC